jgi:hypothetical protein
VATGFALSPETLLGTGEERDATLGLRFVPSLGVEVAEHEYLPSGGILHDGGDELVGHLLKI